MKKALLFLIAAMALGQSATATHNNSDTSITYRPISHSIRQAIRNDFEQLRAYINLHKWTPQIGELYGQLNKQLFLAEHQISYFVKQNGYTDLTDDQAKQIQDSLKSFQQNLDNLKAQPIPTPTPH
jgi:hypothetical protein